MAVAGPCGGGTLFEIGPCSQLVLQNVPPVRRALLHDDELAVVDISEIFEILHTKMIPTKQYPISDLQNYIGGVTMLVEVRTRTISLEISSSLGHE